MSIHNKHAPLTFGVVGAAKIARTHLIPAMAASEDCACIAVASRGLAKAESYVHALNQQLSPAVAIQAVEGYEQLLERQDIDAVYIALPNDWHVPFTEKALAAGKHVLCEKPVALNAQQAADLQALAKKYPQQVMEAFMYRFHPQWNQVFDWLDSGAIGDIRSVSARFCYFNDDPNNIRNSRAAGGGALMDVGCYGISVARWIYDQQPQHVEAIAQLHPEFGVDDSTHLTLDFGDARCAQIFVSSKTQRSQGVTIEGSQGRIVVTHPFYCDPDDNRVIRLETDSSDQELQFAGSINHYQLMLEGFVASVRQGAPAPLSLEDSVANMQVIDAAFESLVAKG